MPLVNLYYVSKNRYFQIRLGRAVAEQGLVWNLIVPEHHVVDTSEALHCGRTCTPRANRGGSSATASRRTPPPVHGGLRAGQFDLLSPGWTGLRVSFSVTDVTVTTPKHELAKASRRV